jgi:two-component system, OmpR family, response regulator CpxR
MAHILLVDDDVELCRMLKDLIGESGFGVDLEFDGERGLARAREGQYEMLILDVMLPRMDGLHVLEQVRHFSEVPVMMLTAKGSPADRVAGFRLGADDYLAKPFVPEELMARMRAIMRRSAASAAKPRALRAGELILFPGTKDASYTGRRLDLTAMECEILEQLMLSPGQVVSRDQLSLHLYKRVASPFDRSIDTHVSRIRRKMAEGRSMILSIRGTGYQLCPQPFRRKK